MKFSIKFKIVALGAVLSLLVTASAIIFANVEYRRREEQNFVKVIDNWLDDKSSDFSSSDDDSYYQTVVNIRSYILEQYETNPNEPEKDLPLANKKLFYKNIFKQLYAIENFGMYPMADDERTFRANYSELVYFLSDTKNAAKAEKTYLAFLTDDNTLFYMGDEHSYKKDKKDEDGNVLIPEDILFPGSRVHNFQSEMILNGNYYDCTIDGELHRVMPISDGEKNIAYIFVQYNFDAVYHDVNSLITVEIIVLSITSVLMILAYALGAHFLFLRNVSKLTKTTSAFNDDLSTGKELEKKDPNIHTSDELNELSNSFIKLEEGIIEYVGLIQKEAREKERASAELNVATNIQLSALPNRVYDDKNVTIRSFIKSAKEVGGDFYDYFYLDDHRLAIIISDVSGKGIPAALFMMKSKELIKSAIRANNNLVDAAKEVNTMLVNNNKEGLFVTSFLGVIDLAKNTITYVNAGHEKPYIVSNKKVTKLDGESNFVMGGEEGFEYKQESHAFKNGEFIFLFTDGLNESINKEQEEFSYSRIEQTLEDNKSASLDNVINAMNTSLEAFVGSEEQFDDVTMLVVKFRNDSLHLSYDKKDYDIIPAIVDHFEESFAYLPAECRASVGIVVDELVNNLISYEKREDLTVDLDFKASKNDLTIVISSNGDDYNPFTNHKEKYEEEFKPDMASGGFGLSLIKNFAKSWDYKYQDHHSIVTIVVSVEK